VPHSDRDFHIACEGAGPYSSGTILRLIVPPAFVSMARIGSSWMLTWAGETGQKYQVQYNTTLGPAGWTNLGTPVIAGAPLISATNACPAGSQGFYRVLVLP
jgi:hypothetical protein